jgi:hypothetical protein
VRLMAAPGQAEQARSVDYRGQAAEIRFKA